ncbi:ABC transporter [Clostridia bacterium]|nr:ABC transporter [Clostridia bacterium]
MKNRQSFLVSRYDGKPDGVLRGYDMHGAGSRVTAIAVLLICVAIIVVVVFPIVWIILAGFKDIREFQRSMKILPQSFSLDGYFQSWEQLKFGKYYLNSLIIAAGGSLCAVLFNGLLAYVLGVIRPRGWKIVYGLVMWTLLIPPTTSVVAQVVNIHNLLNWVGGVLHIDVAQSIFPIIPLWLIMGANAFWLVLFKEFFESLPRDYTEAAQLDGCSGFGIFMRIILPLSRPIVMVIVIFSVTAAWSDFLLPNLLLNNGPWETVMVRLFEFRSTIKVNDVDKIHAVVFSIIPPIVLFALFQKQITNGITTGGIKG